MDAQEFLEQLKKYDCMIANKLIEKERLQLTATGITAQVGGERVQSSGSKQKMADSIGRYIDLEREIDRTIDKLIDARMDVLSVIEQLDAVEYDILHKRYVQYLTNDEIVDAYGKTISWFKPMHKKALKHVQDILDGRKGKK